MTAALIGMGWVTPLGRDLDAVWQAIQAKRCPHPVSETLSFGADPCPVLRVPDEDLVEAEALPRLRRSSRISHLAVTAATDAIIHAGLTADQLGRTALVFATSDGGIAYTRRFYAEVVKSDSGSPLLFPETVYNAPTSHIAARLGLGGEAITLAGDAASGLAAVRLGGALLTTGEVDYCLVVSAQEIDEITCEAYRSLGLIRAQIDQESPEAYFAEGAAALVLAREGSAQMHCPHPGFSYTSEAHATRQMERLLDILLASRTPRVVISGQSGISPDVIERAPLRNLLPDAVFHTPKETLGESLANSTLQHVIAAALALRNHQPGGEILVPAVGFNGQIAALILTESASAE